MALCEAGLSLSPTAVSSTTHLQKGLEVMLNSESAIATDAVVISAKWISTLEVVFPSAVPQVEVVIFSAMPASQVIEGMSRLGGSFVQASLPSLVDDAFKPAANVIIQDMATRVVEEESKSDEDGDDESEGVDDDIVADLPVSAGCLSP